MIRAIHWSGGGMVSTVHQLIETAVGAFSSAVPYHAWDIYIYIYIGVVFIWGFARLCGSEQIPAAPVLILK